MINSYMGSWNTILDMDNMNPVSEAEKEELYFRCKDRHEDDKAERVLNNAIEEGHMDSLVSLAILSSVNKNV